MVLRFQERISVAAVSCALSGFLLCTALLSGCSSSDDGGVSPSGSAGSGAGSSGGAGGGAGSAGSGGDSGTAGAGGVSGSAGLGGTGGDAGAAGVGGNAGSAGTAGSAGGMGGSGGAGAAGAAGSAGSSGSAGSGGATALGQVHFVPFYEAGSAWENNQVAQNMVNGIFAEVGASLRTSGPWDATIEVYLTDDNLDYANTYFDETFSPVTLDGQTLLAVPAWRKIVLGEADSNGPADNTGHGFDFAVAFNVQTQADNAGLLRHEMMHGLGAVNGVPNVLISPSNQISGLVPGDRYTASVYDLGLHDRGGAPLIGNYDAATQTFQVLPYDIDPTLTEWTDGSAGFVFRGVADAGGAFDMSLVTGPYGDSALLTLNEPVTLMYAGFHPTWNHVDEPDRAFFRAMRYQLPSP